jgi:hypothetical protein
MRQCKPSPFYPATPYLDLGYRLGIQMITPLYVRKVQILDVCCSAGQLRRAEATCVGRSIYLHP